MSLTGTRRMRCNEPRVNITPKQVQALGASGRQTGGSLDTGPAASAAFKKPSTQFGSRCQAGMRDVAARGNFHALELPFSGASMRVLPGMTGLGPVAQLVRAHP